MFIAACFISFWGSVFALFVKCLFDNLYWWLFWGGREGVSGFECGNRVCMGVHCEDVEWLGDFQRCAWDGSRVCVCY